MQLKTSPPPPAATFATAEAALAATLLLHGLKASISIPSALPQQQQQVQPLAGHSRRTSSQLSPFASGLQSVSLSEAAASNNINAAALLPLDPTTLQPRTPMTAFAPTPPQLTSSLRSGGGSSNSGTSMSSTSQQSSMEQWNGAAPLVQPTSTKRALHVRVCSSSGDGGGGGGGVSHSATPKSRTLRRKRQQRRLHDAASTALAEEMQLQSNVPVRVDVNDNNSNECSSHEDSDDEEEDGEEEGRDGAGVAPAETTPLAANYRIAFPPRATPKSRLREADAHPAEPDTTQALTGSVILSAAVAAAGTAASSVASVPQPKPWWRKKRVMLPLLCVSCVLLSALIALLVLFPTSPSVTTTSVRISDLSWRADPADGGALTANLTASVTVQLRNGNRFASDFERSAIETFVTLPPSVGGGGGGGGVAQHVATMELPAGYIGPRSELSLFLQARVVNTRLAAARASDLVAILQHMQVSSSSQTHGHIRFLGLRIPYTVQTRCSAICKISLLTLEVDILEQQCDSSANG
jgi:hypothetical protein